MRRQGLQAESSLELLLDTICNTFGGVLFVAILIAVLLQTTAKIQARVDESEESSRRREQQLQLEIAENQATMAALATAAELQDEVAGQLVEPGSEAQAESLRDLHGQRERLLNEQEEIQSQFSASVAQVNDARQAAEERDQQTAGLQSSLNAAEEHLVREMESRTQTASLPQLRATTKREVAVVVRYGRLYVWHRYDQFGRKRGLNTEEFLVTDDDLMYVRTTPKPYAGLPLADDEDLQAALGRRLAAFNPQKDYVAIAIWNDSFLHFQQLKSALVALGFEYRLLPCEPGEEVMEGGATDVQVQ